MKRKYGWRKDTDENRLKCGRPYQPSRLRAVQFPASFDLNTTPNPAFSILDQGNLGACTAFALKRIMWYGLNAMALQQTPPAAPIEPAALFQYQNELILDGDSGQDNGSTISTGKQAAETFGVCAEADWPYIPAKLGTIAPPVCYHEALLFKAISAENIPVDGNLTANLQDALFNKRLPVAFGAYLFQQFESEQCQQVGIVQMPPVGATHIVGHAQAIRGWQTVNGALYFIVNNSWGQWGALNGCDLMQPDYLTAYASDFLTIPQME